MTATTSASLCSCVRRVMTTAAPAPLPLLQREAAVRRGAVSTSAEFLQSGK